MTPTTGSDLSQLGLGDESTLDDPRSGGQRSPRFHAVVERVMWAIVALASLNLVVGVTSLTLTFGSPLYLPVGAIVETANPVLVGLGCALVAAIAMFIEKRPPRRVKVATLLALGLGAIPLIIICVFSAIFIIHVAV